MSKEMMIITKLTAKDIMGAPIVTFAKKIQVGETTPLYAINGVMRGIKEGEGSYGPWTKMLGEFTCIRLTDNQPMYAEECIIQEPLSAYMKRSFFANVNEETGVYPPLEFALKVGLQREPDEENGGVKYKFLLQPLKNPAVDTKISESISSLTNLLTDQTKNDKK